MSKETIPYDIAIHGRVSAFIKENNIFDKRSPIIVGLSGGADSTALLDILICLGYKCVAAHCNFQLRGQESYRDSSFSRLRAKEYAIPYKEIIFDTKDYATKNKLSIEMAARELRYNWFNELLQNLSAQAIAIAHHRDDTIETFFLNLLRGTGVAGLSGINTVNGKVVRPLNCLSREEIVKYLKYKHLDFVTDSTNKKDIYTRNKIRLDLIPLLKDINPNACEAIIKTITNLKETEIVYQNAINNIKKEILIPENESFKINIKSLMSTVAPKTVLFEIIKDFGANSAMLDDIYGSLNSISGKHFYIGNYIVVKDRESLIICKRDVYNNEYEQYFINEDTQSISEPISIRIEKMSNFPGIIIPKSKEIGFFDLSKISFPLILRKWKRGDKFVPFGMTGMKKISDYFSDNKFSLIQKRNTWVLCSGDNIVWIVGERTDNRFRVTNYTKNILMISI